MLKLARRKLQERCTKYSSAMYSKLRLRTSDSGFTLFNNNGRAIAPNLG